MQYYKPNGGNIFVPKCEPPLSVPTIGVGARIRGSYKVVRRNAMGDINYESDWKPNNITNLGLERILNTTNWGAYWTLGSSNQAPANTDTALISPLPSPWGSGSLTATYGIVAAPNYEMKHTRGFRWDPGEATGTVRECVIGTSTAGTSGAAIRFLISPEVTKASDETLDVYHRLEFFPDLINDATGTFTNVHDGLDYAWTLRTQDDNLIGTGGYSLGREHRIDNNDSYWEVHTGELGTYITGWPTGQFDNFLGSGDGSYSNLQNDNTTASVDLTQYVGLDYCNGNIRCFTMRWNMLNTGYRFGYGLRVGRTGGGDEPLTKDNTRILNLVVRSSLTRYP